MTRYSIRPAVLALSLALGAGAAHASAPAQEFIKGVDISTAQARRCRLDGAGSTVQALEDKGVTFSDGGKTGDLLAILKAHGVNYVRLRVWNRPTESGGYNDRSKLLKLAPRVKAAGLGMLVDFRYSDFRADPGKQVKPAAWRGLSGTKLQRAVYTYTKDVLTVTVTAAAAVPTQTNLGQNPGFEDDLAHWTLGGTDAGKIDSKAGNAHGGAKAFNDWYGTPFVYTLTQNSRV